MQFTLFLDRDNTLIEDVPYEADPDKILILPDVIENLAKLREQGFVFYIITNQSGVGRGKFTMRDLKLFHQKMSEVFKKHGIDFQDILICPHTPEDLCSCRKPSPKLINEVIDKFNLSREHTYMIGDKEIDYQCGINAQIHSYQIHSKQNFQDITEKILRHINPENL